MKHTTLGVAGAGLIGVASVLFWYKTPAYADENKNIQLIEASYNGDLTGVQNALAQGADIHFKDEVFGLTPLMYACSEGHVDVALELIQKGARLNEQDNDTGQTALMYAAWRGFDEIAALLITHGADVNEKAREGGTTALMIASQYGNVGVVRILLDSAADVGATDNADKTARDYAFEHNHSDILEMLNHS